MSKISRFFALPAPERLLLFRAWTALAAMRAALWTSSFTRVRRLADAMGRSVRIADDALPTPEKIAWAVATASRAIPAGNNCLVRALATGIVLKRYRYPSELKIGVTKPAGGTFAAHAWLESGGRVVIGDFELDRYVPMSGPESLGR